MPIIRHDNPRWQPIYTCCSFQVAFLCQRGDQSEKIRPGFLLYKILPADVLACKPAVYTFYTSHVRYTVPWGAFFYTDLGQILLFFAKLSCSFSQFCKINCTHTTFRTMEARASFCTTNNISPIYTTFILGPARLKMGTRAVTFRMARLIVCRVNANFFWHAVWQNQAVQCGPGPPKKWLACRKEILRGIRSPIGNHWRHSSRYSFTNVLDTSTHKQTRHPK